ncbi:MAG: DUF2344 domain-containing protein [Atopobiaceae bacterium]|nr:DUF2344 domain-containing protein [Atopobiaceae bacterium]
MAEGQFKLRVAYPKSGRLRFLGHLEFLRTADRCIRRSGLPFAVTQGFKPHMRIAFTGALPLGTASREEYYDVVLNEYVPAEIALEQLRRATPPDLLPFAAGYVDMREPSLEAWLNRSWWHLHFKEGFVDEHELASTLESLVGEGSIEYMRGKKLRTVNLEQTLVSWELGASDADFDYAEHYPYVLRVATRSGQDGSLRPQLLLAQALERMGCPHTVDEIVYPLRHKLAHETEKGSLIDALSRCTGACARAEADR